MHPTCGAHKLLICTNMHTYPHAHMHVCVHTHTHTHTHTLKATDENVITTYTLVSIGPGAIALNLIPYRPHSTANDLSSQQIKWLY